MTTTVETKSVLSIEEAIALGNDIFTSKLSFGNDEYEITLRKADWSRGRYESTKISVSGTDPDFDHPAYSIKGNDLELDKAWKAYNKEEVRLMREAYKAALEFLAPLLNEDSKAIVEGTGVYHSRTAGCSCGCSPAFKLIGNPTLRLNANAYDNKIGYIFITKK